MVTTTLESDLGALLEEVNRATRDLQSSATVPADVEDLVYRLADATHADRPRLLETDPYLLTQLYASIVTADKAMRSEDEHVRRNEVRVALEGVRHALRDILENRPFSDDLPVADVLVRLVDAMSLTQGEIAGLLGVSTRQLQRWLKREGAGPAGADEARIRVVARLVNQLRHVFTAPGTAAWFERVHPLLGEAPLDLLDDPMRFPELVAVAAGSRAMTA